MNVTVASIESCEGSVTVACGFTDDGDLVQFAADTRPMGVVAEALAAGEDVEVEVEEWQVLFRWIS